MKGIVYTYALASAEIVAPLTWGERDIWQED